MYTVMYASGQENLCAIFELQAELAAFIMEYWNNCGQIQCGYSDSGTWQIVSREQRGAWYFKETTDSTSELSRKKQNLGNLCICLY